MDRTWMLGKDLHEKDSLLDGFSFEDVIIALQSNEPIINEESVRRTVIAILNVNRANMNHLLKINMAEIIRRAKAGS